MIDSPTRVMKLLLLGLALLISSTSMTSAESLPAQQLKGAAARDFVSQNGIFSQILADRSPQGQPFSEPTAYNAADYAALDLFGISVAISGDTLIVGAREADVDGNTNQGAAYVFIRSGSSWNQQQKLVADDGVAVDWFGHSVALDGDTALVGASLADVGGNADQGAAYVFTRSGTSWSQQQKLVADDGVANDGFGHSVALDGNTALVGARQAVVNGNNFQGAAYVFTRSGTSWSPQQKLVADDGSEGDLFSESVALDADTVLVGAPFADAGSNSNQGAAYVFTRSGSSWSPQQKLVADDGSEGDLFGQSVALDGDTALVGAHQADVDGNTGQGAAWIFTRTGSSWSQQQKLVSGDNEGDNVGWSVAVSGDTALVGAHLTDVDGVTARGATYVFTLNDTTWTRRQKIVSDDGNDFVQFGWAVTLDEDTALIGAPGAIVGGQSSAGKIYTMSRLREKVWLPVVIR